jgi:hypothetical protein
MKNWLLPIAVLGVSGVGLVFANDRARARVREFFDHLSQSEDPFGEFNRAIDAQLANIQNTLDRLSEALQAPQ